MAVDLDLLQVTFEYYAFKSTGKKLEHINL